MSQELDPGELGPEELSAEDIARRIGAIRVLPTEPSPSPPSAAEAYRARLIAVQRTLSKRAVQGSEPLLPVEPPAVNQVAVSTAHSPEPRVRLIRDSAATLVGLSAVALIVIAVWPPSPSGGVLSATATPSRPSVTATTPSTPEPTPTPTPEPTPSLEP